MLGEARGNSQGSLLSPPTDHDGGRRLLRPFGFATRIGEVEIFTFETRGLIAQQASDDIDRLLEAIHSLSHGQQIDPVGLALLLIPTRTQTQFESAPGNDIQ